MPGTGLGAMGDAGKNNIGKILVLEELTEEVVLPTTWGKHLRNSEGSGTK